MSAVFLYGPLCDPALRAVVLGGAVSVEAGSVAGGLHATGHGATWAAGAGVVRGDLLRLTADQAARLAFYAQVTGQAAVPCEVAVAEGSVAAVLYAGGDALAAWSAGDWQRDFAAAAVAAARDVMALYGEAASDVLARRYGHMLVRGAARVRAAVAGPVTSRRAQGAGDVDVARVTLPYANYFAVEEHDLRFRRFDGRLSDTVKRAAFVMGDAVTVLPYDPLRDRVLLVEQFRAGPYVRGDAECWSLEAIAGRIDAGESPEDAARREAVEEAGLRLGALELVAGYYPSPGAVTEYLYSYVALADLPDDAAGVFGVEGEAEDIRGHLVGFERLMELVASGEVNNSPLVLTALWLQRERGRLRAG